MFGLFVCYVCARAAAVVSTVTTSFCLLSTASDATTLRGLLTSSDTALVVNSISGALSNGGLGGVSFAVTFNSVVVSSVTSCTALSFSAGSNAYLVSYQTVVAVPNRVYAFLVRVS